MELEFELLEKDYINFNINNAKKSSSLKKSIFRQRILGPIIFLIIPFIIKTYSEIPIWYWFIIFGALSVVWIIFYPKYIEWEMARRVRKMLKEGNNENLFARRKIIISDKGVLERSSFGETNMKWKQIDKVEEIVDYIYIYISSVSAHIIPKRVFRDENEKQTFIKEIQKYHEVNVKG